MARRFFQLALWAALIYLGINDAPCHAQTPAAQTGSSPATTASPGSPNDIKGPKRDRPFRKGSENLSPELQKEFDSLPPDQQQIIRENLARWEKMSPEERKAMREREQVRRQKMLQEIEEAIKQSGLQLDDKTRDEYVMRYTEERRKIEQKLQKDMEEKRRPLLEALIARLKGEFQDKSSATPASTGTSPETSGSASK